MADAPVLYLFFEKGIRGGYSAIHHRFAESKPDERIYYFDANNLYGYAMSKYLPESGFE